MELIFNLDEIAQAASLLVKSLGKRTVVALEGDMGAGKTTLVQSIGELLGVRDAVSSPTFSIINQYLTESGTTLYHIDLYRLKNESEAIGAGVEDCLYSGQLCLVEWPSRALGIFPPDTVQVKILVMGGQSRKMIIED